MRRLKKLITVAVLAAFAATSAIADAPFKDQRFVYRADGKKLTDVCVDRNLITGRHPGVVDEFMNAFLTELDRR